jgi:penicillin-binding protein 1C
VIDERAAFIVGDVLADPAARAGAFGLASAIATPYGASVKTGTSKDMRDNWTVGYTDRVTVGVWVGNFDGEAMHDVSGLSGAGPVWRDVMDYAMQGIRPDARPTPPPGLVHAVAHFGALEPDREEWFVAGTEVDRVLPVAAPAGHAHVASPPDGAIFAIDPDIPPDRQKILVRAKGASEQDRFVLPDGRSVAASEPFLWTPVSGRHVLSLVAAGGRVIERSRFEVR